MAPTIVVDATARRCSSSAAPAARGSSWACSSRSSTGRLRLRRSTRRVDAERIDATSGTADASRSRTRGSAPACSPSSRRRGHTLERARRVRRGPRVNAAGDASRARPRRRASRSADPRPTTARSPSDDGGGRPDPRASYDCRADPDQGGWRERPAEMAPRSGADPSNLWGNAREGSDHDSTDAISARLRAAAVRGSTRSASASATSWRSTGSRCASRPARSSRSSARAAAASRRCSSSSAGWPSPTPGPSRPSPPCSCPSATRCCRG